MKQILNVGMLFAVTAALAAGGCATMGGGATDEDQIGALLGQWKEAILAVDADKLMVTYSENFAHDGYDYDAQDKASLRKYIDGAISEGRFRDVEVNVEDAEIAIEEGTAAVGPIDYAIAEGSITIELTLTKEKAGWLITDMLLEGL